MKPFHKVILIILSVPFCSLAQSNYKPGYAINMQGDTIRGFIDYRGWESNPSSISFKATIGSIKSQSLTIDNIKFFNVSGIAVYKKFLCQVSMDETNISRLTLGRDTGFKIETVFLQVLEAGKNVALYSYTDGLKTRYYIGDAPDYVPSELVYRIYNGGATDAADRRGNTINENTYLKQLFALANKYNKIDDDLTRTFNSAGYNKDDLLQIVSKINGISSSESKQKYADKSKFNLFLSAGLNVSNTSSTATSPYTEGGGTSHTSIGPVASLGFNFIPYAISHKVEFRAELSVEETQFSSAYQLKVSPYTGVKASFNQLGFSIAPQIIYNFYNTENFRVYLGVGFIVTHFAYNSAFFGSQNSNVSDQGISSNDPYNFNINDTSFVFTAGIKLNRNLGAFFKFVTDANTTLGGYFQLDNKREQVGLAYFFGK